MNIAASEKDVSHEWISPSIDMNKTVSMIEVHSEGGYQVWSCDYDGRLFVWSISPENHPVFEGELTDASWNPKTDGRPYCLAQVTEDQVWVGIATGTVMAWEIHTRHLASSQCQPLSSQHPDAHTRSIRSLQIVPASKPPVVWSSSQDRTFRRFSWK